MDVNDLRVIVTLSGFVLFLVLVVRTWSSRNRSEHQAAAQLPFLEDQAETPAARAEQRGVQS
jgi:cytochrome c oxidase cbb3-type subunit 4